MHYLYHYYYCYHYYYYFFFTTAEVGAQLLWEAGPKVLVDFAVGSALLTRTALAMGIKCVCVAHNAAHKAACMEILLTWAATAKGFTHPELAQKLEAAKPHKLALWHASQSRGTKRNAETELVDTTPAKKTLAELETEIANVDKQLQLVDTTPAKNTLAELEPSDSLAALLNM